jgi:predicted enzyme related to lactoylglutathione lyase
MKFVSTRIVTDHVPTLAQFYERVTEIIPVGCCEQYVEIETAAGVLAISSQESAKLFNAGAAEPKANRSVIIEFEVADVDRERARLATIVKQFVMEPTNQPWGNRSMLFRDPDGNLINIFAVTGTSENRPGICGLRKNC